MLMTNLTSVRVIICLMSVFLWSTEVSAQADLSIEKKKRHIVSRMHELIHNGKRDCSDSTAADLQKFNDGLASFRAANQEFFRLFEASPYFLNPQGLYKAVLEGKPEPKNCGAALWLLNGLLSPEGQKAVQGYVELLRE